MSAQNEWLLGATHPSPWGSRPGDHLPPLSPSGFSPSSSTVKYSSTKRHADNSFASICVPRLAFSPHLECCEETQVTSDVTGHVTRFLPPPLPPTWAFLGASAPLLTSCALQARRACVFPAFVNKDAVSEWPFLRAPFGALCGSLGSTLPSAVLSVGRRGHTLVRQTLDD